MKHLSKSDGNEDSISPLAGIFLIVLLFSCCLIFLLEVPTSIQE